MGANVLVEFEKKILTGGIFFKNWGQKIILGSRKSAFFGNYIDPWITDNNAYLPMNSYNVFKHIHKTVFICTYKRTDY